MLSSAPSTDEYTRQRARLQLLTKQMQNAFERYTSLDERALEDVREVTRFLEENEVIVEVEYAKLLWCAVKKCQTQQQ